MKPAGGVILIDGTCVFCNRLVGFILRNDPKGLFRFGHIQGTFARDVIARYGAMPKGIDGVYLVVDAGTASEKVLVDGEAGRAIWPSLFALAWFLRWMPLPLLNLGYRIFAKVRYRLFGKYDVCRVPSERERERFVG